MRNNDKVGLLLRLLYKRGMASLAPFGAGSKPKYLRIFMTFFEESIGSFGIKGPVQSYQ